MIVFTLGTIIFPFDRAVDWLDLLLEKEIITEPVLFQHGATSVTRLNHPLLTSVTSLTKTEMKESIEGASLVIAHAGQGSTRMLAKMGASFVFVTSTQMLRRTHRRSSTVICPSGRNIWDQLLY